LPVNYASGGKLSAPRSGADSLPLGSGWAEESADGQKHFELLKINILARFNNDMNKFVLAHWTFFSSTGSGFSNIGNKTSSIR
jgi:hypothetical protein